MFIFSMLCCVNVCTYFSIDIFCRRDNSLKSPHLFLEWFIVKKTSECCFNVSFSHRMLIWMIRHYLSSRKSIQIPPCCVLPQFHELNSNKERKHSLLFWKVALWYIENETKGSNLAIRVFTDTFYLVIQQFCRKLRIST